MDAEAPREVSIPPLVSGGLFLTYRCTCECRHCLYRSSPRQPDEWISPRTAERVFAALAREPDLGPVHLSGGEAFRRRGLLEQVIRSAREAGVRVSYVQTNGFWCSDRRQTRRFLERLRAAGLEGLYVSVSMFHNEYVPFRNSRVCVEEARAVFGESNVTLWSPGGVDLYGLLSGMPGDGTHSLEEFAGWARSSGAEDAFLAVREALVPRGRAVEALRGFYDARPASGFGGETCAAELLKTEDSATIFHYHIDHLGNLVMGCCTGLSPATIEDLHPDITIESHPVFYRLCTRGPVGLMEMASDGQGYRERSAGYVSKCDLCFDVRRHLHAKGGFGELRPSAFYDA